MRSLLLVSGDDAPMLASALSSGADALILDLPAQGREPVRNFIFSARQSKDRPRLFVRINSLESGMADADLDAIMPAMPDGIVLRGARGGADVQHLGAKLAVREAQNGLPDGACAILSMATQMAASLFGLSSYMGASRRLLGLIWSAEDFAAALGGQASRLEDGAFSPPCQLARTLTLAGARAAGIEPVDAVFADWRDEAGLRRECKAARRDGFSAKVAVHPAQVAIINEVFGA